MRAPSHPALPVTKASANAAARASRRILATGILLAAFLCGLRYDVVDHPGGLLRGIARLLLSSFYDFAYAASLTAVFLLLLLALPRSARARWALVAVFVVVSALSLLAGLVNQQIVPIFGKPFTYPWLYYSDFLKAQDARNAIHWMASGRLLGAWTATLILFLALLEPARWAVDRLAARWNARRLIGFATAAAALYFLLAGAYFAHAGSAWQHGPLGNPIVVFARSALRAHEIPSLASLPTRFGPEDFAPPPPSEIPTPGLPGGRTRNVIVIVLETVPAGVLEIYGGRFPATPELTRLRKDATLFSNVQASSPSTESSFVSLHLSVYPWLSFRTVTREYPNVPAASLPSELHRRGFRTGFFNSSDLRYAGLGDFLTGRGYERIDAYRHIRCGGPELLDHNLPWDGHLDGVDDACTMDEMIRWISEPSDRPFFGVLWTMMTHLPYFPPESSPSFGVSDSSLDRYLRALRHDDEAIGKLVSFLEERGLSESTLLVFVGDHGESFGQHEHRGHGSKIYQEDVHVPLLFVQKGRFRGETVDAIGGIVDVAPTILDVLGYAPPPGWQGRSLYRHDRSNRAYFFTAHSDFLLGLREGNLTFLEDLWHNRFEVYDLTTDPAQTHDLSGRLPERVRLAQERLTAWVQYQERMYERLGASWEKSPAPPSASASARRALNPGRAGA